MTIKISVELLQKLIVQSADLIGLVANKFAARPYILGPAAVQFVKLLNESGILIDVEWEILAQLFTSPLHPDQIENICFRAMQWGISDMSKLVNVVEAVEKEEF